MLTNMYNKMCIVCVCVHAHVCVLVGGRVHSEQVYGGGSQGRFVLHDGRHDLWRVHGVHETVQDCAEVAAKVLARRYAVKRWEGEAGVES